MPASMNFKYKKNRIEPKAKVKYYVKAILKTPFHEDEMKHKQVMIIREKPVPFEANNQQFEDAQISTWCCIDQGSSKMWTAFEKNWFTPTDTARSMIHIDNS